MLTKDIVDIVNSFNYKNVTNICITNGVTGLHKDNGVYVDECVDDSLYAPDSGHGVIYYPIETGQYLAISYEW